MHLSSNILAKFNFIPRLRFSSALIFAPAMWHGALAQQSTERWVIRRCQRVTHEKVPRNWSIHPGHVMLCIIFGPEHYTLAQQCRATQKSSGDHLHCKPIPFPVGRGTICTMCAYAQLPTHTHMHMYLCIERLQWPKTINCVCSVCRAGSVDTATLRK